MPSAWIALTGNMAAVALVVSIWAHLVTRLDFPSAAIRRVSTGVTFGIAATVSLLLSVEIDAGVYIDLRYGLIACAMLVGGPIPGAIALLITATVRLSVGGAGAYDAMIGLVAIAAVSFLVQHVTRKMPAAIRLSAMVIAVVSTCLILINTLSALVKADAHSVIGAPFLLLNAAAMILTFVFMELLRRSELENRILRTAFKQAPDFLYVKDRDSRFVVVNHNTSNHHHFPSPRAMVGLSDHALVPGPRAEELYEEEQQIMRAGKPMIDKLERIDDKAFLTTKVPCSTWTGSPLALLG